MLEELLRKKVLEELLSKRPQTEEDVEPDVDVTVRLLNGEVMPLRTKQSTTIAELKNLIQTIYYNRKVQNPMMSVGNTVLEDSQTVESCDLADGLVEERTRRYDDDLIYFVAARRFNKLYPEREVLVSGEALQEQIALVRSDDWQRNKNLRMKHQGWSEEVRKSWAQNREVRISKGSAAERSVGVLPLESLSGGGDPSREQAGGQDGGGDEGSSS